MSDIFNFEKNNDLVRSFIDFDSSVTAVSKQWNLDKTILNLNVIRSGTHV